MSAFIESERRGPSDAVLRIVIAEPAALLRELLVGAFRETEGVEVVGVGASRGELLAEVRAAAPDVVLAATAFRDGGLDGVLADVMRTGARVLVVCDVAQAADATALLFAGASGCLYWQDCSTEEMVAATREVAAGHAALHPAAAAAVLAQWRAVREPLRPDGVATGSTVGAADPPEQRQVALTPRETEVLTGLARGLPTKTIGRELGLSPKTVEAHIGRLLSKLDVRNRAHAVSVAQSCGLLPDAAGGSAGAGR